MPVWQTPIYYVVASDMRVYEFYRREHGIKRSEQWCKYVRGPATLWGKRGIFIYFHETAHRNSDITAIAMEAEILVRSGSAQWGGDC